VTDPRRDRAVGALLGLAVGDALGTTLEFSRRDTHAEVTDLVGGGPFGLRPGEWTDDTAMALCLADSLLAAPRLDPADLMRRFVAWRDRGHNSCTGDCFDIGHATAVALRRFGETGDPYAGSTDPRSAGNGCIMRLAPVAIRWHGAPEIALRIAADQARTTHGTPECIDASAMFAEILCDAIGTGDKVRALSPRPAAATPALAAVGRGDWWGKERDRIDSSGWVTATLEAALWSVSRTASFEQAVILAANLADDADTVAAVTGQIAGALYGAAAIPARWLDRLAWRDDIAGRAGALFDAAPPGAAEDPA
jgi:ADP-ribosyl-[dinitrogen reductase] hydrolase